MGKRLAGHIRDNRWQYRVVMAAVLLGIVLGCYRAWGMAEAPAGELMLHLQEISAAGMPQEFWAVAWLNQATAALLLGVLGLTVIGLPVILAILLYKAYALGFSVILLLTMGGGQPAFNVLAGLLLPNLVYLTLLALWAVPALNFSLYLIDRHRQGATQGLGRNLLRYCALLAPVLVGLGVGALLEVSLAPLLLEFLQGI
ncbi:MAG: stage II sporulation protein M [Syntrophomonadaceae bacterium]|nr:stage II sporulation protein M [Syntrophomonadaceae bacterium]